MKKFLSLLGFDAEKKQTSVKTDIVAGIVTFLAMAYILTVNPAQILVGADQAYWPSVFIATAFGAIIGTLLMAFLAKCLSHRLPVWDLTPWSAVWLQFGRQTPMVFSSRSVRPL